MADLVAYRGDTTVLTVTVNKADGSGAETITGYVFRFCIKRNLLDADADAVVRKDNAGEQGGVTILTQSGATLGQFTVTINPADTSGQPPVDQVLIYEVQSKDTGTNVETIARGVCHLLADAQRTS